MQQRVSSGRRQCGPIRGRAPIGKVKSKYPPTFHGQVAGVWVCVSVFLRVCVCVCVSLCVCVCVAARRSRRSAGNALGDEADAPQRGAARFSSLARCPTALSSSEASLPLASTSSMLTGWSVASGMPAV